MHWASKNAIVWCHHSSHHGDVLSQSAHFLGKEGSLPACFLAGGNFVIAMLCVFYSHWHLLSRDYDSFCDVAVLGESQAWEEAIWVKSRKQILKKPMKKPTKKPLKKPCRLLKAVRALENVSLRPTHDWLVPTRKATSTFNNDSNDTIDDGRRQESDECETKIHLWL